MQWNPLLLLSVTACTLTLVSAGGGGGGNNADTTPPTKLYSAVAMLNPTAVSPSAISGNLTLAYLSDKSVSITLTATGLSANSVHGIHIHAFGGNKKAYYILIHIIYMI